MEAFEGERNQSIVDFFVGFTKDIPYSTIYDLVKSIKFITCFSFAIGVALMLLPYDYRDRDPVPVVIFNCCPSVFYALVISNMFSFAAAFFSMMLTPNAPKIAKFFTSLAILSMATTMLLFAFAFILCDLKLLCRFPTGWSKQGGDWEFCKCSSSGTVQSDTNGGSTYGFEA